MAWLIILTTAAAAFIVVMAAWYHIRPSWVWLPLISAGLAGLVAWAAVYGVMT